MFGINQLPEVHSYWSKNPLLCVLEIQKVFSRNRFKKVSQYLHVNDKNRELARGDANHDKLYKVRPLLDSVVSSIPSEYRPTKNVSIDEAMISFKGRLGIKQYMPLKPVKRGIKVWECADALNGYVCNLSVYTGKERHANPEQGLGYRVVHNLTRPLVGKNHHDFIDTFFSSIVLAENLLRDQIYVCGTVRSNRQGIPREIAPTTQQVKRLQQGESLFLRKENVIVTVWKDKKPVYFLSTQSNPVGDERVNRRQRDGSIVEVPSVPVVKSYNNNMGGVDLSDQLRRYYMTGRKSMKWWRCLVWFLVDVSIVNAHILERLSRNHRNRTQQYNYLNLVLNSENRVCCSHEKFLL
ncbi:piggyBac transposable element-derived protein 4-like [Montipora foliosa]|uniref:piggyBac transposable element-derived protein 4-like n=1 Tax=Montipora foliosa TaxID=591990 RepID=UPI0035F1FC76